MAKRIMAKTGTYTNREGEQKNNWLEIGVILSNQNGDYMLLKPEVDLAGVLMKQRLLAQQEGKKAGDSVMCSIFDNDQQQASQGQAAPAGGGDFDDMDSEIPF